MRERRRQGEFRELMQMYERMVRHAIVTDITQVDAILCRDLDSHITPREVAAVEEFFSYPKLTFHTMRDNPAHTAPVMGGMWGAKVDRDRQKWIKSFKAMYKVRQWTVTKSFVSCFTLLLFV